MLKIFPPKIDHSKNQISPTKSKPQTTRKTLLIITMMNDNEENSPLHHDATVPLSEVTYQGNAASCSEQPKKVSLIVIADALKIMPQLNLIYAPPLIRRIRAAAT